jgi:hypothetical protein
MVRVEERGGGGAGFKEGLISPAGRKIFRPSRHSRLSWLPTVKIIILDLKTKVVGLPLFSGKNNGQMLQRGWEGRFFWYPKIRDILGKCSKMLGYIKEGLEPEESKKVSHSIPSHTSPPPF